MRLATTCFFSTVIVAGLMAASPSLAAGFAADTQMVRLEAKDPNARPSRGVKEQTRSDLNQIIVYYNAAIKLDPRDDDAYFHRALANFYTGSLPQALADLSQASKLDLHIRQVDDAWYKNLPRDADAATQAWLDRLPPEAVARSNAYYEGGYWLQLWNFLAGRIMPIAAGLAVIGAIFNFMSRKPAMRLVASAVGLLTVSAVWKLLVEMM